MIWPLRMTKNIFLIFIVTFLSSCSFLSSKVESLVTDPLDAPISTPSKNKKKLFCFDGSKTHLMLEDDSTQKYYQQFAQEVFQSNSFSFVQKAAMLSLIEMSRRPDQASPASRLQYFLRYKNKDYYYDISNSDLDTNSKMPYLKAVELLLKNFDPSRNLTQISTTLDSVLPPNIDVSPEFENFLKNNRSDLQKNDFLLSTFFKGDEVLTKHESFKRASLKKIVSIFYTQNISNDNHYQVSKNLMPLKESGNLEVNCNVDINDDKLFKEESDQKKSHYFSIKEDNNFFIAVSSAQISTPLKTYDGTYFFKNKSSSTPLPICQFKSKWQDITLFSTEGRNPNQHLKHLLSYDIQLADSFNTLGELLNFSRHLFLDNPDRILYESKRGRKSQLDFFLTMNFPIYHVESLGDVIGSAAFKNGSKDVRSLVVDDRGQSKIWCDL